MGEDPRTRLRDALGEQVVVALEGLDDAEAERLYEAIAEARRNGRLALREAAEESLGFVPRFARGAVKKIVFG